jgi:protein gp37
VADTTIEWSEKVWNPTTGCDKLSPGCDNCYALTMAKRLKAMGQAKYQTDGNPITSGPGFGLAMHPDVLPVVLGWKQPRRIFVNSMSDLFHAKVTRPFIAEVFAVMAQTPQHTYQVLTKRARRARRVLTEDLYDLMVARLPDPAPRNVPWPLPNVWLGTSVEDQERADERVPELLSTPSAVRWLSCEPLLGPVDLGRWMVDPDFNPAYRVARCGQQSAHARHVMEHGPDQPRNCPGTGAGYPNRLDWVVIGGESGTDARPMDLHWARSLVEQCQDARVPVFVKQLGEAWARDTSWAGQAVARTDRHAGKPEFWPQDLRVREYPQAVAHA